MVAKVSEKINFRNPIRYSNGSGGVFNELVAGNRSKTPFWENIFANRRVGMRSADGNSCGQMANDPNHTMTSLRRTHVKSDRDERNWRAKSPTTSGCRSGTVGARKEGHFVYSDPVRGASSGSNSDPISPINCSGSTFVPLTFTA